jgi:hypothetical protein
MRLLIQIRRCQFCMDRSLGCPSLEVSKIPYPFSHLALSFVSRYICEPDCRENKHSAAGQYGRTKSTIGEGAYDHSRF